MTKYCVWWSGDSYSLLKLNIQGGEVVGLKALITPDDEADSFESWEIWWDDEVLPDLKLYSKKSEAMEEFNSVAV